MQSLNLFHQYNSSNNDADFSRLLCAILGEDDANYCYAIAKLTRIYGQQCLIDWATAAVERLISTGEGNSPGGMLLKIIREDLTAPVWKTIFKKRH